MPHIRAYTDADWPHVQRIYQEGIDTGIATFETRPKPQKKWEAESVPGSQLVAEGADGAILGWALLWPTSSRRVYAGVAEVSIYVAADAQGQGVGKALTEALIGISEKELGIWTLQAGIFEENPKSLALHKSCGFRVLGTRERIGQLRGVWRNIIQLERRSNIVGT